MNGITMVVTRNVYDMMKDSTVLNKDSTNPNPTPMRISTVKSPIEDELSFSFMYCLTRFLAFCCGLGIVKTPACNAIARAIAVYLGNFAVA